MPKILYHKTYKDHANRLSQHKIDEYYTNYSKIYGNEFSVHLTAKSMQQKQTKEIFRNKTRSTEKLRMTDEQIAHNKLKKRSRYISNKEHDKQYSTVYIDTHKEEIKKSRLQYYKANYEPAPLKRKPRTKTTS